MHEDIEIREEMLRLGMEPPSQFIADGVIHRFSSNGKVNDNAGWYVYTRGLTSICHFGCFRSDIKHTWDNEKSQDLTTEQKYIHLKKKNELIELHKAEKLRKQEEAKQQANKLWNTAVDVKSHPYLEKKGVKSYGIRQIGSDLIIKITLKDEIHSVQFITNDGSKRFLSGGRINGCHFTIGYPQGTVYIAEGYATAASIHEATGKAVVVAFNAGNLLSVSKNIRESYPNINILICADKDANGIGFAKANEAATTINAKVIMPEFGESVLEAVTDFNDLHQLKGLSVVKQQLDAIDSEIKQIEVDQNSRNQDKWVRPEKVIQDHTSIDYPVDALPKGIADAVKEVLEYTQCPPALASSSALSALSLAAQHIVNVKRDDGLVSPVSLYFLSIAESGERKSTVDNYFSQPIKEWEKNEIEKSKPVIEKYIVEIDAWNMQYQGLKQKIKELTKQQKQTDSYIKQLMDLKANEPQKPRVPRLVYADVTPEQLGYSLAKIWPSAGILSSEAGIVFGSHGMSANHAMGNMALLNILWDGGDKAVDRKTSESFRVQNARLTMGLAVQADTIMSFVKDSKGLARGTGFLARFLFAWPKSTQGERIYKTAPVSWPMLKSFQSRITNLLCIAPTVHENFGVMPRTLIFTPEAKKTWIEFYNKVENELRTHGELSDARDVGSKAADNVARLAALFQLFQSNETLSIEKEYVESAIVIVTWHLFEAKKFLNQAVVPDIVKKSSKLDEYILRHCIDNNLTSIPKNFIRQNGPIRDKKLLNEAIEYLIDTNRVRVELIEKTHYIFINPALLEF